MSDQGENQSSDVEKMMALLDEVPDEEVVDDEDSGEQEVSDEASDEDDDSTSDTDTDEEEAEDDDSDEQTPSTVKLKINGEEIDKPLDEVVALAQQGLDYTKKTQEVAEQRKALEDYAQTIKVQEQEFQQRIQLQNAMIGEVAQLTNIDSQLEAFNQVNWQQLSDSDFVEAQKLFFTYNQLQQQRATLVTHLSAKQEALQAQQTQSLSEQISKGKEVLAKEIPNWSRETSQAIISTGKDYGFTDDELGMIVDPRHVKVLHDAMQWRKLQSNTGVKNKVANAKPVVKPGAKDSKNTQNAAIKSTSDALRKTGKSEYAAKLIENMI